MWQVVQEALEGGGGGRELQRKLRSVAAVMEWARGASRELGGDLASWDCQLQTRLRNDAENRVPPSPRDRVPLNPRDQLGRYLAELAEAMDRGLGPQRAARLGACLSATDRVLPGGAPGPSLRAPDPQRRPGQLPGALHLGQEDLVWAAGVSPPRGLGVFGQDTALA